MKRFVPHAVAVVGIVLAVALAGRVSLVINLLAKKTFDFEGQSGLKLLALAIEILAGFLLAAPAWWPRPRLPRRAFSFYLLALYGVIGLFLVTPTLVTVFYPWLPAPVIVFGVTAPDRLLPGIQSTSVTVRTVGCLLIGYGLGQSFGQPSGSSRVNADS